MRIVLTSVHCWPDVRRGGERYVHELSAALARAGHDVRVVSTGAQVGTDDVLGVPVRRLPVRHAPGRYPHPWEDVAVETAFGMQALGHLAPRALLREFDVWHATSTSDAAAAAAVGKTAPRVTTVFTDHGFPARTSRRARPDRRQHGFVAKHVDSYVCVSRAAGNVLTRDFGRVPHVVPPGVRLAAHTPAATRHPRPAVLYSGSLVEPRKNVALLLEAMTILLRTAPDAELWLLGPGDPSALLAATTPQAREAVTTARLATDEELRETYARAWVTALPSHAESFGMSVVESLASGTPAVVLEDGGGPAEIVDSDRVGRRCAATADGLAAGLEETLTLSRDPATADACRERARAYDWDAAVVPALERVYAGAGG